MNKNERFKDELASDSVLSEFKVLFAQYKRAVYEKVYAEELLATTKSDPDVNQSGLVIVLVKSEPGCRSAAFNVSESL